MKTNINIFNELNSSFEKDLKVTKRVIMESDKTTITNSNRYQVRKYPNEEDYNGTWGIFDTKTDKFIQKGSKSIMNAGLKDYISGKNNIEKTIKAKIKEAQCITKKSTNLKEDSYIREFTKDSPEYHRLEQASAEINKAVEPEATTSVGETYFDYRQDWAWTTILAKSDRLGEWQALNPRQQEAILSDNNMKDAIDEVIASINHLSGKSDKKEESDTTTKNIKEDEVVILPDTTIEPDYLINDVTVLDNVADGDVQSPDIDALLTLVDESLKVDYGTDWGRIHVLSSKVNENSSFAVVDISTKEIIKEFEQKGIKDVAVGKNLIIESAGKLLEFKVNSLNGITRYSKKTSDIAKTIKEWIETEYLHESMIEKEEKLLQEKTKAEKEAVENYLKTRMDLIQTMENIKMFIELSKSVKASEEMKPVIQDRMYGLAAEFPASIEVSKDNTLTFSGRDQIVEILFGKEWIKEPSEDNKVLKMVIPGQKIIKESEEEINSINDKINDAADIDEIQEIINNIDDGVLQEIAQNQYNECSRDNDDLDTAKSLITEVIEDNAGSDDINESYQQFNIGDIEVVFNPDTYECLYSIPSADVKDKKINLADIPTVDVPYDTNTIIKSYIETKFGKIPSKDSETTATKTTTTDTVTTDTQPTETATKTTTIDDTVEEAELPEEPDETGDVNVDVDIDNPNPQTPDPQIQEAQSETGNATFIKIRPKQTASLEEVRERMLDADTPKSSYIVVETKDLPEEEWNTLTSDLTAPQSWLEGIKAIDRKNYSFNVVKVTSAAANFALLIDPLGYNYPRYLAIDE